MKTLEGKKIAILTDIGFEESELLSPRQALEEAGAKVEIVSLLKTIKGWDHDHWGVELERNADLLKASPEEYDGLMIPGGVMNPDKMRADEKYVAFAKHFMETGKPIAAICHAPQLLIETGLLSGRNVTSYPSLQTDLKNAGANWEDSEVVVDNGLVTSRSPKDLPAFNAKMIEEFGEGQHPTEADFIRSASTMN